MEMTTPLEAPVANSTITMTLVLEVGRYLQTEKRDYYPINAGPVGRFGDIIGS